jgi:predicted nucleic acid-binding Zn ribbon protein
LHFNSVEQILAQLERQPGWSKFRDYRQLLKCWHNTVSKNTAQHTRPLYITRQVLRVATNSASRAQELSLSRYTLLKRLNQQLPFTLKDIRFSSLEWHQTNYQPETRKILFNLSQQQSSKPKNNLIDSNILPQRLENISGKLSPQEKAKTAAKRCLDNIQQNQNSTSSLSCPNCGVLTPIGEIERWNLCYLCIAQKWSKEYRPPTFDR